MKHFSFSFLLLGLLSACNEATLSNASVEKDCTGTYIRWNNQDFHVCNTEKTDNIASGTSVQVDFEKIEECKGPASEAVACFMLHPNEGWIEIKRIK